MEDVFLKKNKRQRIFIASAGCVLLLILVLWFRTQPVSQLVETLMYWLLFTFSGILIWWALEVGKQYKYLIALVLLVDLVMVNAFVYSATNKGIIQIVLIGVYGIAVYTALLIVNILLVATQQPIPLKRAAISTLYLGGLMLVGIYALFVLQSGWGINLGSISVLMYLSAFVTAYFTLLSEESFWIESVVCVLVLSELGIMVNLFAVHPLAAMAAYIGWSFLVIGIIQHHVQKDLKLVVYREYIFIATLLLFVYFGVR